MSKEQRNNKISPQEKKALGIVLTGNFLEYFDLMLFSHLAFVVSPYFMPKSDPTVAKMLAILTFSSSFVIRPFAVIFWGYIGDNFGRVVVLSYTTLIMAVTCFLIPNIPSYEEIGLYATFFIILCRILQGFSSAGEAKGAEIFVAELVPRFPKIFSASILVPITCDLGGLFATLLGAICLSMSPDGWKICFYIGSGIAFCSSFTRKKLKETKDFINYSRHKTKTIIKPAHEYFEKRNFFALIGLNMICPTAFYFAYSFGSDLLKDVAGLSPNTILLSNSFLLVIEIFFLIICARLAYFYNPFYILKVRTFSSFILMPLGFLWVHLTPSHTSIFMTQLIVLLSTASFDPATPLVIRSFAIQSRFSRYSKAWALAKAIMYLSTGYLTFYIHKLFGLWGVLYLLMFFSTIFAISLHFFVPSNEMEERFKNIKSVGLRKYNTHGDFLNHKDENEITNYHSEYLNKWIDK